MPVKPGINAVRLEKAMALGEASMQLEGFHPEADAVYLELKAEVLAGRLTFDEAVEAAKLSLLPKRQHSAA